MLRPDQAFLFELLNDCQVKQVLPDREPCFILSSGNHTRVKYHMSRLFQRASPRARLAEVFEKMIAESALGRYLTVLAGPESVGPFLAELQHYRIFKQTRIALAKKDSCGGFLLEDGLDIRIDDRFLIVDDVLTAGGTVCRLQEAVADYMRRFSPAPPHIVGSAVIVNRMPECAVLPHRVPEPCVSLLHDRQHPFYEPDTCPFCSHQP